MGFFRNSRSIMFAFLTSVMFLIKLCVFYVIKSGFGENMQNLCMAFLKRHFTYK